CSLMVNQTLVSAPRAPNPIKAGITMAAKVALAPRCSAKIRVIAPKSDSPVLADTAHLISQYAAVSRFTFRSWPPPEHIDDAQRQGCANNNHQRRQDESHQRQG